MSKKNHSGAIFDMDGVLIDSYWAHFKSWQALADDTGRAMTEEEFARTFGRTSREVITEVWPDKRFSSNEVAALDRKKEDAFRRLIEEEFPAMPGAKELIHRLSDEGFDVAIGSSGPPENVQMVLDRLAVAGLVQAVVTGADVRRGKPDPQVFQVAAERLGKHPGQCVVVEDAPDGIRAARAAGMAVVGLASTGRDRQALSFADLVVDSLEELSPQTFRELMERGAG
jgi:beta-phosphoglucomutase